MGITCKRKLRAGRTVWQDASPPRVRAGRMRRGLHAEVLVVGAGVSGAMIAEALASAGLDVVIVDRRGPLAGSTPASTALLQYEIDTPLHVLARRIGRGRAERIWRRSRLALDALRERSRHLGIEAGLVNRDSLFLEGNELDAAGLHREAGARRRAGFEVNEIGPAEVRRRFGIKGRAALMSYDNLAANPLQLAAGFLRASINRGARLLAPVEIANLRFTARGVTAVTADRRTLRAEHVVFATGYEMLKGIPLKGHTIASTWAIATRPQPKALWSGACFIWEASDPYLYLRATPDGRIICGGEDEEFSDAAQRDALLPTKTARLELKLSRLMPGIDARADYA